MLSLKLKSSVRYFSFTNIARLGLLLVLALAALSIGHRNAATAYRASGPALDAQLAAHGGFVADQKRQGLNASAATDPTWSTTGSLSSARYHHTATLLQSGKVLVAGGFQGFINYLASAELFDPATGTWSATGSLAAARYQHTATLLPNGKVLVAGGFNNSNNALNSAELYDPATGTWSTTDDLSVIRLRHTATLLANGKVLVVGGTGNTNSQTQASAEIYDPATGNWSATGSLTTARSAHAAARLSNGKVLVAGGFDGSNGVMSAELYDPATGNWSEAGEMSTIRRAYTATLLPNGKVLVAGGAVDGITRLQSAELYDPVTGMWSATGSLADIRSGHTAALLPNGKVLVAGGLGSASVLMGAELYDPATGTWSRTSSLETLRYNHTATLLPSGQVMITGGISSANTDAVTSTELYDLAGGTWTATGSLTTSRYQHTTTLLPSGKVLAAGGRIPGATNSAELYDPATGMWTATGGLVGARYNHTATLLPSGKVLVVGGIRSSTAQNSAELYDPATGIWTTTGSLAAARCLHTATLLPSGRVLVAGGNNIANSLSSAELYDPATGLWTDTGSLVTTHTTHTATLLPSGKVLVAGGNSENISNVNAEIYDPATGAWSATGNSMAIGRVGHSATLLPSGKVLVAGGTGKLAGVTNNGFLSIVELYDPATGAWSTTGSLAIRRIGQAATLLPSGKVLITGGDGANSTGFLNSAELYDPATGIWMTVDSLVTPRVYHTLTLLPSGKVMVTAGNAASGVSNSAELYDPGLGFDPNWQPLLTNVSPASLLSNDSLMVSGSRFKGISEASGGNSQNSSSSYPLVQLMSLTNQQTLFLPLNMTAGWSDTSFTSTPITVQSVGSGGFPRGFALVTVFTNGIPSRSRFVQVANVAPNIMAGAALTRQQGSPSINSAIATVSDADQVASSLTVTATTVPAGITVSNIANTNGTITADVAAECNATVGAKTVVLTVNDGSLTNTASLTVNVTANTAPTLSYNNASTVAGSASTVNPATGPSDNVSISTIAVQSVTPSPAPATITVNNSTGVVTAPNNVPSGSYSIVVRATDNCGITKDATFTLNVTCVSSLTVNNLGDGTDAAPGNGVCETATGNGICTLRAAIQEANALQACSPFTINFSVTGTINLATALPDFNHPNLTVAGPGANQLTVQRSMAGGTPNFRIFYVGSGKTVALSGLTITNGNTGGPGGGGIFNAGTLNLADCIISNNQSGNLGSSIGGGVGSVGPLTVTRCLLSGNSAYLGGGIYQFGGTLNLTETTLTGNTANFGGGANAFTSAVTLTNCTISGNSSSGNSTAGGLDNSAEGGPATLNLINCTITGNTATGSNSAGGLFNFVNGAAATMTLKNTIVAGNSGRQIHRNGGTVTSLGYNLSSDGGGGFLTATGDLINRNPLLAPLGNYGGPMQTHALLPGSPAINAGTNTGAPVADQRGIARPQQTAADIGAYESRGFTLAIAGGNNQSANVNTAFANPLSVTVTSSVGEPVNGGSVTFTPPGSGASTGIAGNPATIASGTATSGTATANGTVGGPYNVAASASGATEINFSLTNTNPPPTILAGVALTRQQGTSAANSPIATVTDPNQTAGTLTVMATTVPTGITVGNIVNANGAISADVAALCNATAGTNTVVLTVTDSLGAMTTANLTINVTANTAPTLSYNSASTVAGSPITINPATGPSDNGSVSMEVQSVTPSSAPATITLSNSTGVVTAPNTIPPGSYSVVIRATDNCGTATDATFTLNVICVTSLTVNNPGDGADAAPGNGVCETASGNGTCTLRAAIQEANALQACLPFTINFSGTGTINLATALPALNHPNLTITGPGANQLTVQRSTAGGTPNFGIFTINAGKTAAISGLTIANGNTGGAGGGGIINVGTLSLTDCVISNNNAGTLGGSVGGGVGSFGPLTVTRCAFTGNSANAGGAIAQIGSTLMVTESTMSGNMAAGGGGLFMRGATATLTNCTISGNTGSSLGGGIANSGSTGDTQSLTLLNCTIANNTSSSGAGILTQSVNSTSVTTQLKNTLVAGNNGVNFATSVATTMLTSQGNNLDSDGSSNFVNGVNGNIVGTSTNKINALLATLGNYGGPTQTHALLPGSPAINTGTNAGAPSTDQRGIARPQQTTTDIGAFESRGFTLALVSGDNQTTPPTAAFTNPLLVSVISNFGEPVQGGLVTFTPPASGPSATLSGNSSAINANSQASVNATANNQQGSYQIAAAANGANTADFTLTNSCSVIVLGGLPNGQAGTAYSQSITASPAGGGYTFAQTGGTLPPGLMLASNGALSGTPAVAGTYTFTVTATGFSSLCNISQSYTLVISCPVISLSPASLPNATVNTAYPQTITASPAGGSYSFAVTSGLLPVGLTLNSNGSFSGAPTQSGSFTFRVAASGFGACNAFRDYTLIVACPGITLNPATLTGGSVGTAYQQSVSAMPAGTYSYSVTSGALPTGLTLNGATGAINGAPMTSGSFTFVISASAGGSCFGSRSFTVAIACAAAAFTTTSLPVGNAGAVYSQTLNVSPSGSYTFSLAQGSLPSGLTLNPATGVISGLSTVSGSFSFVVKAQIANGCNTTQAYSLAINCPATINIAPATLPDGSAGTVYQQSLSALPAGGNYRFAVNGALPGGLSMNPATGSLSGTPTASSAGGTFTFTVTATGFGACTASKTYTIVIGGGACPTITLPDELPAGSAGTLYTNSVAASPAGSYGYAVTTGSLPPGVTLYGSIGLLYGYPTAAGSYNFTITATGANTCTGNKSYRLTIGGPGFVSSVFGDFDGDGKADFSVWRGKQGAGLIVNSRDNSLQTELLSAGQASGDDVTVAGDYDGDGKTDLAIFRRATGSWLIKSSQDGAIRDEPWGLATDTPVPGDYDGDGKTDLAVWRGADANWYIRRSSDLQVQTVSWGTSNAPYRDLPVPADYDGDGKTDIAVFRQMNGHWYIKLSSDGSVLDKAWGLGTDVPVAADYDGDGKADIAVWRGTDTNWYIIQSGLSGLSGQNGQSSDQAVKTVSWGTSVLGDVPTPADYDGDGKADVAIWRASSGVWFVKGSRDDLVLTHAQGQSDDRPFCARNP